MHTFINIIIFLFFSGPVFALTVFNNSELKTENEVIMDRQIVETTVNEFKAYWDQRLQKQFNKNMQIQIDWDNTRADAHATRDMEDNLIIKINGGLLRQKFLNESTLHILLCHELGHYIGGAPKSFRGRTSKRSWSSAEGQADYFAINKCLLPMLRDNPVMSITQKSAPIKYHAFCAGDIDCMFSVDGAVNLTMMISQLKPSSILPSLTKKSNQRVSTTIYNHPSAQCRLDTFIASLKCSKESDLVIDDNDYRVGSCIKDYQPEAARPACWFNPEKY